jgi:hypothetical protein
MRQQRTYGSVRGAISNGRPYRARRIPYYGRRFCGAAPWAAQASQACFTGKCQR